MKLNNTQKTIIGFIAGLGVIFIVKKIFFKKKNKDSNISLSIPPEKSSETTTEKPKSLLFIGDSLTADNYNNKPVKGVYSYLLREELRPKGIKVDTLAKVGMRTDWMADNLPEKLKNNKYDRIYIYGGINDILQNIDKEKVYGNIQKMVDLAIQNGAKPYVLLGYDTNKIMTRENLKPTKYSTVDQLLVKKQRYLDYQNNMKEGVKNANFIDIMDIGSESFDGIHPKTSGQKMIKEIILKTL